VRLDRVDFVLVRPARVGNVAAACRALKNMGLRSLRLVAPPPGLAEPEVRALAYGAWDVLDAAQSFASLPAAVADAVLVVATSGRGTGVAWTPRELAERAHARCGEGRLAIVFGPEASGLTQTELRLCHEVVRIPTDPAQPSLNLAQAVLLVAYELFLGRSAESRAREAGRSEPPASAGDIEAGLAELRQGLIGIGYLNPDDPDAVFSEIRRLLARAVPTAREVTLVRGLARQVAWAGRRIVGAGD
jgi:TrmH family RNA methyltransferase